MICFTPSSFILIKTISSCVSILTPGAATTVCPVRKLMMSDFIGPSIKRKNTYIDKTTINSYNANQNSFPKTTYQIGKNGGNNMARAGLDKETVLQMTADMADKEGLSSVTLKELANRLGIRPPSLYNHVKGLDDLRNSLMLYGWKQLENEITVAAIGKSGDEAVKAMCKAYVNYATKHPGVFDAMQWYNQCSSDKAMQTTEGLVRVIFQVLSSYELDEEHMVHTVRMLRSFLQGFVSINNNGGFGNPVSVQKSFDLSVEIFLKGLVSFINE